MLLTVDHPKCGRDVAWVHEYGKSRVFYLMFGHGPSAWQNPNYAAPCQRHPLGGEKIGQLNKGKAL